MRAPLALLLGLVLPSCVDAAPPAVPAPAPAPAPRLRRASASDAILPTAVGALRVDVKRLRASPLYAAALAIVRHDTAFGEVEAKWSAACDIDLTASVDELYGGFGNYAFHDVRLENAPVIALHLAIPAARVIACLGKISPGLKTTQIAGHEAVIGQQGANKVAFAADGDVLWITQEAVLPLALEPHAPSPLLAELGGPSALVMVTDKTVGPRPKARLDVNADGFALDLDFVAASEKAAGDLASQGRAGLDDLRRTERALEALKEVTIEADGARVHVHAGVHGSERVQATAVGALAAIGTYAVRRVASRAKTAEARFTVLHVAKELARVAEESPKKRLPKSGKAVPAKVPRGEKVATTAADWQGPGWVDIHFTMPTPMFYQYEFVTSPDGKRAVVRAHGDLDGNAKESLFEVTVSLDAKGAATISPLTVKDELE